MRGGIFPLQPEAYRAHHVLLLRNVGRVAQFVVQSVPGCQLRGCALDSRLTNRPPPHYEECQYP